MQRHGLVRGSLGPVGRLESGRMLRELKRVILELVYIICAPKQKTVGHMLLHTLRQFRHVCVSTPCGLRANDGSSRRLSSTQESLCNAERRTMLHERRREVYHTGNLQKVNVHTGFDREAE
jgi:hypothetical protein